MESSLIDSIFIVCKVLNEHSVQYMIVGGAAVALHGYFRNSTNTAGITTDKPDVDVWYNPTYVNYFKLLDTLEELGQNVTVFKEEQTPNPKKSFFKYELENFTLDFLPELKASLPFRACYERKEVVSVYETDIVFISLDDLIQDKQVNSRPKDVNDIEQLNKLRKENE